MLHDFFHRLHLVYINGVAAEFEEVADEYRTFLLVYIASKFLVFCIVAGACSELQRGYRLGIPGMADAVLTVVELSEVGQEANVSVLAEGHVVQSHGIAGYCLEADAAHC